MTLRETGRGEGFSGPHWALKTVRRSRYLAGGLFTVLPQARRELRAWEARAHAIPDPEYRALALSSIRHKAFHSEGGAMYAMAVSRTYRGPLIGFIVAVQTISDYLDTLCDRHPSLPDGAHPEDFFRGIHAAFACALRVDGAEPGDTAFPVSDGGYLARLVRTARAQLSRLRGARSVSPAMVTLGNLYSEFQSLKHLGRPQADERLARWYDRVRASGVPPYIAGDRLSELHWWEFGAAAGSTLGIFALATAGARNADLAPSEIVRIVAAYFPFICAYHILLDYLIDQREDAHGGDLNLIACYPEGTDVIARLRDIREHARRCARPLDPPDLHPLLIAGLTALYITDPKVGSQPFGEQAQSLLKDAGMTARILAEGIWISRVAGIFLGPVQPPARPATSRNDAE